MVHILPLIIKLFIVMFLDVKNILINFTQNELMYLNHINIIDHYLTISSSRKIDFSTEIGFDSILRIVSAPRRLKYFSEDNSNNFPRV